MKGKSFLRERMQEGWEVNITSHSCYIQKGDEYYSGLGKTRSESVITAQNKYYSNQINTWKYYMENMGISIRNPLSCAELIPSI